MRCIHGMYVFAQIYCHDLFIIFSNCLCATLHFQMNSSASHWVVIPADIDMLKTHLLRAMAQNLKVARDWSGGAGGGWLILSGT